MHSVNRNHFPAVRAVQVVSGFWRMMEITTCYVSPAYIASEAFPNLPQDI